MIDYSKLYRFSGYPQMKDFTDKLGKSLDRIFPDLVRIIPEGIPNQMGLITWIITKEGGKACIHLKMYPAGFSRRYNTDVTPHYSQLVETIRKNVIEAMRSDNNGNRSKNEEL